CLDPFLCCHVCSLLKHCLLCHSLCVLSDILFNSIVVVKQKVSLFEYTIGKLQHQLCTTATKKKRVYVTLNFRFFDSCGPK
ncbi:unnamed protein product, partial [Staurois parvus]